MLSMRAFALLLALTFAGAESVMAKAPTRIIDVIDVTAVTQGLPLENHQFGRSGDNRKRHRWTIKGADLGTLEIIGEPTNADRVVWQCSMFDKAGNALPASSRTQFCHRFFVDVLSRFTSTPAWFAEKLLAEAEQEKRTVDRQLDNFVFDTDGVFFGVRRLDRMKAR